MTAYEPDQRFDAWLRSVDDRLVDATESSIDVDAALARVKRGAGGGPAEPVRRERALAIVAGLTARQQRILEFVRDSTERNGYPPSVREIGEAVGLVSPSSVAYQLRELERKGYLRRDPDRPRAVGLRGPAVEATGRAPAGTSSVAVPLVGRIAAGGPVLAEATVEGFVTLPRSLVGDGTLFALTVTGDSMTDAAIHDGDVIVVLPQAQADDGETVAAMLDGEATVKVYRKRDGHVWLMPRNPAYAPIPGDDATILGKVVAVVRRG
nr:transcriptional repressor LexA [Dactylosporangium thailandense]